MSDTISHDQQPITKSQPVTFSAEQQAKLDEIIKDSMRRTAREVRQQLDIERQEKVKLDAELKAAQEALSATATERDNEKNARLSIEQQALKWRKDAYIAAKCVDFGFIDAPTVSALVERNLAWNETTQDFDVIEDASDKHPVAQKVAQRAESDSDDGAEDDDAQDDSEDGQSTAHSVTPDEFFARFAMKKPYLVRSDIKPGSGSSESSRTGLPTGRQEYKVEEIFGKGSSSQLANRLAQTDKAAYRRLKVEARQKKLI
jgi:hypothetical protein